MTGTFRFGEDATRPWEWMIPQKPTKEIKPPDIRSRTMNGFSKRDIENTVLAAIPTDYDPFIVKDKLAGRFKRKTPVARSGEMMRRPDWNMMESVILPFHIMPIEVVRVGKGPYWKTVNTETGQVHAWKTSYKDAKAQARLLNSLDTSDKNRAPKEIQPPEKVAPTKKRKRSKKESTSSTHV